jgi:hypothetical protein
MIDYALTSLQPVAQTQAAPAGGLYLGTWEPPRDGEPCSHPGCLRHITHPCEGCGRIAGKGTATSYPEIVTVEEQIVSDIRFGRIL